MKSLNIFLYEWKHLVRSPFKVIALALFVLAGVYGLHNGASLYHEQISEIERINENIEADAESKNRLIRSTLWFNPVTFFQNQFNRITQTHYDDYQNYRDKIQTMIDIQIKTMVLDTWNDVKVDKSKYIEYHEILTLD